ncbi:MAG TPA: lytic transglycosylase domain-containing protein [Chitinophagaceae bacterium]|nr:lytic transglycosylase domain-containing protein [Chitinophagaceae bacterium]
MNIRRKHNLFAIILVALTLPTQAREQQETLKTRFAAESDTTIKGDSLARPIVDLKQGFRDLFLVNAERGEINVGELNPMAVSFVQDYIQKHGKTMEDMKDWGRPYFDMMDQILGKYGLPKELKYLAVIESHLKAGSRSWAGAVGPWQFMPGTARLYGLRVGKRYDERTDYYKSTVAASRYLSALFSIYGDWLLVVAAYNGGPGNVNEAIRRSGSRDFWKLQNYLPTESKNHVKKFIATHYIMEGQGGVTTVTRSEMNKLLINPVAPGQLTTEEIADSKAHNISRGFSSVIITKHINMDIVTFNRYNPEFDAQLGLHGKYELRLPIEKMNLFVAKREVIFSESLQFLASSPVSPGK